MFLYEMFLFYFVIFLPERFKLLYCRGDLFEAECLISLREEHFQKDYVLVTDFADKMQIPVKRIFQGS